MRLFNQRASVVEQDQQQDDEHQPAQPQGRGRLRLFRPRAAVAATASVAAMERMIEPGRMPPRATEAIIGSRTETLTHGVAPKPARPDLAETKGPLPVARREYSCNPDYTERGPP